MEISETTLREWHLLLAQEVHQAEEAIAAIESEYRERIAPLKCQIKSATEKLRHIEGLLKIVAGGQNSEDETNQAVNPSRVGGWAEPTSADERSGKMNIAEVAFEILSRHRKEMYYKDLADEILAQGYQINSQQPATYLLAYIGKDARFEKTKRGYYKASRRKKSAA